MSRPTSPGEVPFAPLAQLAERYIDHAARLVNRQHGRGELLAAAEVRSHALAALAYQRRLADEALAGRWIAAATALEHGAPVTQVARAAGLDGDELRSGMRRWACEQARAGHFTPAERDDVLRLVADQLGGGGAW
jgi:hypothetical protein